MSATLLLAAKLPCATNEGSECSTHVGEASAGVADRPDAANTPNTETTAAAVPSILLRGLLAHPPPLLPAAINLITRPPECYERAGDPRPRARTYSHRCV